MANMSNNQRMWGGIGIGLLAGAIAGATLGLLYSPHSGKVNREIVDEKLRDATRRAEKIMEEAKDRAEDVLKKARVG